jgi:hypothetical protein
MLERDVVGGRPENALQRHEFWVGYEVPQVDGGRMMLRRLDQTPAF